MTRYVWADGAWREAVRAAPHARAFYIGRDTMEPTLHPCTGQLMDSKSAFRAVTKANGMVELGNDWTPEQRDAGPTLREVQQDVAEAWTKLEQGYEQPPMPETPRELQNVETVVYE